MNKRFLMTLSIVGAVAAAATAQEAPPPKIEAPQTAQTAAPKPGEPQTADPKTPTPAPPESNNLKFGFYGIADVAVLYRNHVLNRPKGSQTDVVTLISGGHNQSRIGIKGSYELGNGLRAVLQLEKGINYNDGTIEDGLSGDPRQFFNRIASIGLEQDGLGRFTVGRQLTVMYDMAIQFDPLAYSPTFSWLPTTGSADQLTGASNAGRFGSRVDNVFKYTGRFNDLQVGAYYALGQNTTSIGANSKFGGGLIYTVGPLSAAVVYDQRNSDPGPYYREQATLIGAKLALFGGRLIPTAGYRRYVRTMSSRADDLYFAGVTLKATAKLAFILADYYDKKRDGTGQNDNLAVVRAEYALGKIVDLYATYGYASAESGGLAGVMRANDTLPVASDQSGVSLGFRIRYGY
jgi:predicted porin